MTNSYDSKKRLDSPFRGIRPFRYIDRDYYYGRKEIVTNLFSKILTSRVVILFGPSGCGKSSLINAGLVPKLIDENFKPERIRLRNNESNPFLLRRLRENGKGESKFLRSIFLSETENSDSTQKNVFFSLNDFSLNLKERANEQRPAIIFDQFEELFTRILDIDTVKKSNLQTQILDNIVEIANNTELKVKILIVIREDFLGKLEILASKYPQIFDYRVSLGLMNSTEAFNSITMPFDEDNPFPSKIGHSLAYEIIKDLKNDLEETETIKDVETIKEKLKRDPRNIINPTQLQIICLRLWETYAKDKKEITIDDYIEEERVNGILKSYLESELDKLGDPDLKNQAIEFLSKLITEVGTRDLVSIDRLKNLLDRDFKNLERIKGDLGDLRLINEIPERDTYYYEISSEYLIPAINKELQELEIEKVQEQADIVKKRLIRGLIGSVSIIIIMVVIVFYFLYIKTMTESRRLASHALNYMESDNDMSVILAKEALNKKNQWFVPHVDRLLNKQGHIDASEPEKVLQRALSTKVLHTLTGHGDRIHKVEFSPDGKLLTSASWDGTIKIWDYDCLRESQLQKNPPCENVLIATLDEHLDRVYGISFNHDGSILASGSWDGTVKLWSISEIKENIDLSDDNNLEPQKSIATLGGVYRLTNDAMENMRLDLIPASFVDELEHLTEPIGEQEECRGQDNFIANIKDLFNGNSKIQNAEELIELYKTKILKHSSINKVYDIDFNANSSQLAVANSDGTITVYEINPKSIEKLDQSLYQTFGGKYNPKLLKKLPEDALPDDLSLTLLLYEFGGAFLLNDEDDYQQLYNYDDYTKKIERVDSKGKYLETILQNSAVFTVSDLEFNKTINGPEILTVANSRNRTFGIWDIENSQYIESINIGEDGDEVNAVALSSAKDGVFKIAVAADNEITLWNYFHEIDNTIDKDNKINFDNDNISIELLHDLWVYNLDFNADGTRLASASLDRSTKIWDVETGVLLHKLSDRSETIHDVSFYPLKENKSVLATGSWNKEVKIWDPDHNTTLGHLNTIVGHTSEVRDVNFNKIDNRMMIASAGLDGQAYIWDPYTGEILNKLVVDENDDCDLISTEATGIMFSPNPEVNLVAVAYKNGKVNIWELVNRSKLDYECWQTIDSKAEKVFSIAFSPYAEYLAIASWDGSLIFWDINNDHELFKLTNHDDSIFAVTFNSHGDKLATASLDRTAKILNLSALMDSLSEEEDEDPYLDYQNKVNDKELFRPEVDPRDSIEVSLTLIGHNESLYGIAFHPVKDIIATSSRDGTVKLWDSTNGRELSTLKGHTDMIMRVTFSPGDGDLLASSSFDGTAKLWNVQNENHPREILTLYGHDKPVIDVSFSPDQKLLATSSIDKTIRIYDLDVLLQLYTEDHAEELHSQVEKLIPNGLVSQDCLKYQNIDKCEAISHKIRANKFALAGYSFSAIESLARSRVKDPHITTSQDFKEIGKTTAKNYFLKGIHYAKMAQENTSEEDLSTSIGYFEEAFDIAQTDELTGLDLNLESQKSFSHFFVEGSKSSLLSLDSQKSVEDAITNVTQWLERNKINSKVVNSFEYDSREIIFLNDKNYLLINYPFPVEKKRVSKLYKDVLKIIDERPNVISLLDYLNFCYIGTSELLPLSDVLNICDNAVSKGKNNMLLGGYGYMLRGKLYFQNGEYVKAKEDYTRFIKWVDEHDYPERYVFHKDRVERDLNEIEVVYESGTQD